MKDDSWGGRCDDGANLCVTDLRQPSQLEIHDYIAFTRIKLNNNHK